MWVCEVNRSEPLPDGAKRRGGRTASSASNSDASWSYTYDNRGHVTTQTLAIPGQPNQTFQYAYSAYGALASVTYPDGQVVAYAPDALGRPTQAGSYATGATYQTDGSLESFTYAGGHDTWLATEYASGRLHNLTVGNGGTLVYSEDFTYDPNANITQMTDLVPSGNRTTTFAYDALNRLAQATNTPLWGGTNTYTYDALGNLRHLSMPSFWDTYNYGPDFRLTGVSYPEIWGLVGDHMQYNAQGEVTQTYTATSDGGEVGVQNIAYSAGHRLLAYGTDWTYAYDAAGRRVKARQAGGTTTYYAYGQGGHLLLEWQSGTHTDYVYLGNRLVAKDVDGTTTLLVTDVQGSLVATLATDGTVLGTLAYNPYGGQAPATFYPQRGIAYTGHYLDATNLLYMQQRYYNAGMKRFLSPDPVAPVPGNIFNFNRYAYANDNPVVITDPTGMCGEVSNSVQKMRNAADTNAGGSAQCDGTSALLTTTMKYTKDHLPSSDTRGAGLSASGFMMQLREVSLEWGGKWNGGNGSWYGKLFYGNQFTALQKAVLRKARIFRVGGQVVFGFVAFNDILELRRDYKTGNGVAALPTASDLYWGFAGSFAGPAGLAGAVIYTITSKVVTIPVVYRHTVIPATSFFEWVIPKTTDLMCQATGNC